jgi:proline iminopeptidase
VKVRVGDVDLFFDVEGVALHADGRTLSERPTLVLLHGGPGADHNTTTAAR